MCITDSAQCKYDEDRPWLTRIRYAHLYITHQVEFTGYMRPSWTGTGYIVRTQ